MEGNESLALVSMNLAVPNLWENSVAEKFPEKQIVIQNGHPSGNHSFSGLLKMNKTVFPKINRFVKNNFPSVTLEHFYEDDSLFYFTNNKSPLANIFSKTNGILRWPAVFQKDHKKINIILKRKYVEGLIDSIENKKIDIKNFSVVRANFGLKEILTPKQKEILKPSVQLGYYQFPKQINLNCLAKKLGISPSTLCVHLQKIESRILNMNLFETLLHGHM